MHYCISAGRLEILHHHFHTCHMIVHVIVCLYVSLSFFGFRKYFENPLCCVSAFIYMVFCAHPFLFLVSSSYLDMMTKQTTIMAHHPHMVNISVRPLCSEQRHWSHCNTCNFFMRYIRLFF